MGKEVDVAIEIVDEIEKDASGKYRYVVSRVAEKVRFLDSVGFGLSNFQWSPMELMQTWMVI